MCGSDCVCTFLFALSLSLSSFCHHFSIRFQQQQQLHCKCISTNCVTVCLLLSVAFTTSTATTTTTFSALLPCCSVLKFASVCQPPFFKSALIYERTSKHTHMHLHWISPVWFGWVWSGGHFSNSVLSTCRLMLEKNGGGSGDLWWSVSVCVFVWHARSICLPLLVWKNGGLKRKTDSDFFNVYWLFHEKASERSCSVNQCSR